MNIIKIVPRGFCKGVVNAINKAKQTRDKYPNEDIYILGMIVHNKYITKALSDLNIITLMDNNKTKMQLLEEIDHGVVIFTAHGIDHRIKERAIEKGLIVVDASCEDVLKTQNNIKQKINEGYDIIYIGTKNHPEALAVLGLNDNINFITDIKEIDKLDIDNQLIYVTNQTTMSILEIKHIYDAIKEKYPNALIEQEICNATFMRQNAIMKANHIDLLYVVGDPKSNNTNKLKEIGLNKGIKEVRMIETAQDINIEDLKKAQDIGVTSGASTPTYLTNQIINVLEHYAQTKELIIPEIDYSKIL